MPPTQLNAAIEALLFSSDQPLPLGLMSEALDTTAEDVQAALQSLGETYSSRHSGVELREIAGGWMLVTTPEQSEWVGRLLRGKKKMRLSRAGLETMAIIAYKQPVTKSEVEAIRGVDSSGVLATLLERNLVTIRGRSKVVGRPLLYGTTQEFLEYFGLRDLAELPRPEELRALVAAREPEQLEMMELEVVSQVASELAAAEAVSGPGVRHQVLPLEAEPPTEDERAAEGMLAGDEFEAAGPGDEEEDEEEDEDDLEDDDLEEDDDDLEDDEDDADDDDGEEDDDIIDDEEYDEVEDDGATADTGNGLDVGDEDEDDDDLDDDDDVDTDDDDEEEEEEDDDLDDDDLDDDDELEDDELDDETFEKDEILNQGERGVPVGAGDEGPDADDEPRGSGRR